MTDGVFTHVRLAPPSVYFFTFPVTRLWLWPGSELPATISPLLWNKSDSTSKIKELENKENWVGAPTWLELLCLFLLLAQSSLALSQFSLNSKTRPSPGQHWMLSPSLPDGTELNHENEIRDSLPGLQPIRGQSWIRPGAGTNQGRLSARSRGWWWRWNYCVYHQNTCCSTNSPHNKTSTFRE